VVGQAVQSVVSTVESYDVVAGTWRTDASLNTPRGGAAVVSAGGQLYVMGGLDDMDLGIASVEVLDVASGTWSAGPSLNAARGAACAGLGPDGRIYVAGGQTAASLLEVVCSMEVYEPGATSWLAGP